MHHKHTLMFITILYDIVDNLTTQFQYYTYILRVRMFETNYTFEERKLDKSIANWTFSKIFEICTSFFFFFF